MQILVIDDELEHLNAVCAVLQGEPYTVLRTTRPERAVEIVRDSLPDLIITDWDMPGLSGIDLIRAIKADERTKDIPVIMCTGKMTSSENLETALEAGAIDYVRKPLDPIELRARTRSMLQLSASYRQLSLQREELARQNGQLNLQKQELYLAATTDQLTGIHNRAYLIEALVRMFAISSRHQHPLSCVLLDIDHFKSFNDRFGHQVGDEVLRQTAERVSANLRTGDIVARYGGEEFVVLLPNTSADNASMLAETIRTAVEQAVYAHEDLQLNVTISLGVADTVIGTPINADSILNQADQALYAAKDAGRNRVVVFSPQDFPESMSAA